MFISPMLLQEVVTPPEDFANVITELKLDGIRLIYTNLNDEVKLYTRHNHDVTDLFPEITSIQLPKGIVLDGELIAPDLENKPDYQLLMNRFKSKQPESTIMIQYVAFDIIYYKGRRITQLPLIKRKSLLDQVIPTDNISIVTSQWVEGNSQMYFDIVKDYDLEGIVVKKPLSKYQSGIRSNDWIKVINYKYIRKKAAIKNTECWLVNQKKSQKLFFIDSHLTKNRNKLYEKYRQFLKNIQVDSSK